MKETGKPCRMDTWKWFKAYYKCRTKAFSRCSNVVSRSNKWHCNILPHGLSISFLSFCRSKPFSIENCENRKSIPRRRANHHLTRRSREAVLWTPKDCRNHKELETFTEKVKIITLSTSKDHDITESICLAITMNKEDYNEEMGFPLLTQTNRNSIHWFKNISL